MELEKRILTFTWKKTQEIRDLEGGVTSRGRRQTPRATRQLERDGLGECRTETDRQTHGTDCRRGMSGPCSPEQSRSHVVRCSGTVASVWKSNVKASCQAKPRNALLKARD